MLKEQTVFSWFSFLMVIFNTDTPSSVFYHSNRILFSLIGLKSTSNCDHWTQSILFQCSFDIRTHKHDWYQRSHKYMIEIMWDFSLMVLFIWLFWRRAFLRWTKSSQVYVMLERSFFPRIFFINPLILLQDARILEFLRRKEGNKILSAGES